MPPRILIVEDDPDIAELVARYLEKAGFSTERAGSGREALAAISARVPDLMVLDLMLPHVDGLEVCRAVRANEASAALPIIMVTARAEESERIVGLELGADDYIVKPFSPREVVARVRAVLRRVGEAAGEGIENGSVVRIRDLEIDEGAHEVRMGGQVVAVTPAEFRILSVLVQNAGQVLTRSQLLDLVHDDGSIFERTLDRHINNLRRKIEVRPDEPSYIVTVYGVGYKLRKE
jgi:DNA-binding response OmpR family regulator